MRTLSTIFFTVILLALAAATGSAQTSFGLQNIGFGRMLRGAASIVAPASANAAEFLILGTHAKKVRLTITAPNLTRSGITLTLAVTNADCQFSRDLGITWTTFSTGTLFEDTTFPAGNGTTTILVRVGGRATAVTTQHLGDYTGNITVTAGYQ